MVGFGACSQSAIRVVVVRELWYSGGMEETTFIGQRSWQAYFQRLSDQGMSAHAYLFVGPRHIGKRTFAERWAAAMVCTAPVAGSACGTCRACQGWQGNVHGDVSVFDAAIGGGIDEVRAFLSSMTHRPSVGRVRVGLVLSLDACTPAAHHALLKTLEEPSPSTLILATAAQPLRLPATIRSRMAVCQFSPVPPKELTEALIARHLSATVAAELASLSLGRPGLALRWANDSATLATYKKEAEQFAVLLAGRLADRFAFTETVAREELRSRLDLEETIRHWMSIVRDGLLVAANQPGMVTHQFLKPTLQSLEKSPPWWAMVEHRLLTLLAQLRQNANRRLAFNSLFLVI